MEQPLEDLVEETPEEEVEENEIDYEETAKAKGWRPIDDFDGDKSEFVSAEEFVKREPLFNKIKSQSKELKEMRRTVDAMATHFKKQTELEVKKAINELKAKRREAIELGDSDQVDEIDSQIEETKKQNQETQESPSIPTEVSDWIAENSWFEKDTELKEFAIAFNQAYINNHPNDLKKSLVETTKAVKVAFPDKFVKKESKPPVSAVEGGVTPESGKKGNKYTLGRLSDEQKLVYEQMVKRHKVVSHDEFFKSLEEIGEL